MHSAFGGTLHVYKTGQMIELNKLEEIDMADVHMHPELLRDLDQALEEARGIGIHIMIGAGTSAESSKKIVEISHTHAIFATVGIAPDYASSKPDLEFIEKMEGMIKKDRNIVGIGEIGLDTKIMERVSIQEQKKVFERQLEIAQRLDMAVVIHSRGALHDVRKELKEMGIKKAIFHFYEGDEISAKEIEKDGYLISIPPLESGRRKRVIKAIDIKSIVTETDSPAATASPSEIPKVIEMIAKYKEMQFEDVARITFENIRGYLYI